MLFSVYKSRTNNESHHHVNIITDFDIWNTQR